MSPPLALRLTPPWTDGPVQRMYPPFLQIGFVDGWYIIRGRGGHITCSTPDPTVALRLIALESEKGFGAVEQLAGKPDLCPCHGMPPRRPVAPTMPVGELTLADLGL